MKRKRKEKKRKEKKRKEKKKKGKNNKMKKEKEKERIFRQNTPNGKCLTTPKGAHHVGKIIMGYKKLSYNIKNILFI